VLFYNKHELKHNWRK